MIWRKIFLDLYTHRTVDTNYIRDVEQTPSYRLISLLVSTVTIVQLIDTSEAPEVFQYLRDL